MPAAAAARRDAARKWIQLQCLHRPFSNEASLMSRIRTLMYGMDEWSAKWPTGNFLGLVPENLIYDCFRGFEIFSQ